MFTGIVETVGRVANVERLGGARRLTIEAPFASELRVDQSVSVDGACQTVVRCDATSFDVVAIEETLAKTTFGSFEAGRRVNLERAMRPDGRLDGHIVQGHVDATGTITDVRFEENSRLYVIRFQERFAAHIIPVGSISVDGISLTVARLEGNTFTVAIIPHTLERTIVGEWTAGRSVNLEFDMIGKYVARYMQQVAGSAA
ncbi:MAG: riboflavin synthase [Bacteroidota bacterium]